MNSQEQAVAKQLASFAPESVPYLVEMLSLPDKYAAKIASFALGQIPEIDPKYLPAIVEGLDRGLWLPAALARIGTPEAAEEAVNRYIIDSDSQGNTGSYALELLGETAVPFLVAAAKCDADCGEGLDYRIWHALEQMDENARAAAVPHFMAALTNSDDSSDADLERTIYAINALGAVGIELESPLLALWEERPILAEAIRTALIGIHSPKAVDIFASILEREHSAYNYPGIAELGNVVRDLGPQLMTILNHQDWDKRRDAARVLGFIGYVEASPALIELLEDGSDPQLDWTVVESLGRLGWKGSLPALQTVEKSHWYPPVRDAASKAIRNINRGGAYEQPNEVFAWTFSEYDRFGSEVEPCEDVTLKAIPIDRVKKLYLGEGEGSAELKKLTYESVILSYGPPEGTEPNENGIIEVTQENMVEYRQYIDQTPDLALRVDDGWLAGSSRGEWGGEAVFVGDDGNQYIFFHNNIEDIYKLGNRYVAVAGLGHMGLNRGWLYELERDDNGIWKATNWKRLPGPPDTSWIVDTGELLVNTYYGSILISKDGSMRMAPCK